ncbi:MAG: hypothetical protein MJH09_12115, partial [Cetobacterium sp.]|nr:hypothetical protein [Cetobacterium sp.]
IGDKFIGVQYFLNLFLVGAMLFLPYMILSNYLFYLGKTKVLSFFSVLSTVIYLSVLFLLLPYGIDYLPYATITGQIVTVFSLGLLFYFWRNKYENGR